MAKYDTTIFNKRLAQIASELQSKIRAINENGDLSNAGKARAIERAREESRIDRAKLGEEFQADVGKRRDIMSRKKEPKPGPREIIRRQSEEAEQYPTLYNDALRADAEIELWEKIHSTLERMEMRDMARQDGERFFTEQLASEDKALLERYQKHALPHLPKEARERLEGAYTSRIQALEEEQTPPELREFDEDVTRFNYSLEAFDKHGTYTDYRQKQQAPENETVLRPYEVPERAQPAQSNGGEGTGD